MFDQVVLISERRSVVEGNSPKMVRWVTAKHPGSWN
jgi:hypothetical protein